MWRDFLQSLGEEVTFHNPAGVYHLDEAESKLGVKLPVELRELLRESNGVEGEYGLGLVWSIDRIVQSNMELRTNQELDSAYMPFTHLLFFADAGNGDQFAYAISASGEIRCHDIYAWNHEDDSRTAIAPTLKAYLEGWLTGRIKL